MDFSYVAEWYDGFDIEMKFFKDIDLSNFEIHCGNNFIVIFNKISYELDFYDFKDLANLF